MSNVLCEPKNATRRQLRQFIRRCLVHAAGEKMFHADCIVTSFWLNPWRAKDEFDGADYVPPGEQVLVLGCRVPRSLREIYSNRLRGYEPSKQQGEV